MEHWEVLPLMSRKPSYTGSQKIWLNIVMVLPLWPLAVFLTTGWGILKKGKRQRVWSHWMIQRGRGSRGQWHQSPHFHHPFPLIPKLLIFLTKRLHFSTMCFFIFGTLQMKRQVYLSKVNHVTEWNFDTAGGTIPVRVLATPYLVSLFTLVYIVLFHLLLPSYLDVPCYLNNRQRYCSVWPERDWTLYNTSTQLLSVLFKITSMWVKTPFLYG